MPLRSNDLGPLLGGGVTQREVAPNIWVSTEVPPDGVTVLRTGSESVRVNVTKAGPVPNTALGRALGFLKAHSGEPVIIAGPDADLILQALP